MQVSAVRIRPWPHLEIFAPLGFTAQRGFPFPGPPNEVPSPLVHHPIADDPGPVAVDGSWVDTVDGSDILILKAGQEGELEDISGVEKLHGFHLGLFASDKITDNFFLDDHAVAQDSQTRMVPGPTQHFHVELELEEVHAFFLNDDIRLRSRKRSAFKLVGTEINRICHAIRNQRRRIVRVTTESGLR